MHAEAGASTTTWEKKILLIFDTNLERKRLRCVSFGFFNATILRENIPNKSKKGLLTFDFFKTIMTYQNRKMFHI